MTTSKIDKAPIPEAHTHELPVEDENPVMAAIDAAEEIRDPLDGLVERAADDPGAPFASDVLERLKELKETDRGRFEAMRAKLKDAGVRVTSLDTAMREESGDTGRGPTQAETLIDLAGAADLFRTNDGIAYADITVGSHRETWPVRSTGFKRWLARQYFEATGGAANSEATQSALNLIEAKAHFEGDERPVFLRVGGVDNKIYLDLCDEDWRAVEISASGWRVIDNPPVRFRRAAGMQPLPVPEPGGSIEALRGFLNVKSDADFVLVVSWAMAVLRNLGPYPLLVLSGEQGSAKSTFSAMLRALLDPNTAPLRALPREDRDLFIAASNGHVLTFDNVSGLRDWVSDTLCRLATGGGFAVRQLYTDQDEVLFDAARPVILNGIEDIVSRPDLADRSIFLSLEAIPEERRRSEAELWAAFEAERPKILGVLLDGVARGLKDLAQTELPKLPRMADFALWASACETAIWPKGTFWSAYCGNREEAVESVIDADPVANAILELMSERTEWTGTATDLLGDLSDVAGDRIAKARTWPGSPRALSGRLRRAATFLRTVGIDIDFVKDGGKKRSRIICLTAGGASADPEYGEGRASIPSDASVVSSNDNDLNILGDAPIRTVDVGPDGTCGEADATVRANPLKSTGTDGPDVSDANFASQSEPETTKGRRWRETL